MDDVDGLVDAVRASGVKERTTGYPRLHPVRMQPWGHRVGFLIDLDGTQLQLISNAG